MKTQTVITGITSMKDDHICISGYDVINRKYLRPLIEGTHLTSNFLSAYNDLIKLGSTIIFNITNPTHDPISPHSEDIWIDPHSVNVTNHKSKNQFKEFIVSICDENMEDIFGYEIELIEGQPVLPKGAGSRSLGSIISRKCRVYLDHVGKFRCDLIDASGCEFRHIPIVGIDEWVRQLGEFSNVPIRLSLSRLFQKDRICEPYYWVQVSGIII